jgi:hypothetical protein
MKSSWIGDVHNKLRNSKLFGSTGTGGKTIWIMPPHPDPLPRVEREKKEDPLPGAQRKKKKTLSYEERGRKRRLSPPTSEGEKWNNIECQHRFIRSC